MCRHFSKVTYCLMQYVPKRTWKWLVRIRQLVMAVNINLTLLNSAFNKYINWCLQIFEHDLIVWTNIQCSDTYYKSAVWHRTKTIIQMQTFYSCTLIQCKAHQKIIRHCCSTAEPAASPEDFYSSSSFRLTKPSAEIKSHLWEWWQYKIIII